LNTDICAGLNYRKKKSKPCRLVPWKLTANLQLQIVAETKVKAEATPESFARSSKEKVSLKCKVIFTTPRSLAVTTTSGGCRFLNRCWFKNTNQSWMRTTHRCLYAFSTCNTASCILHDVTRHHHRYVSSLVTWLPMPSVTTSLS